MSIQANTKQCIPSFRILFVHGHTQSAAKFRAKTGNLRKAIKSKVKHVNFVFAQSPIQIQDNLG